MTKTETRSFWMPTKPYTLIDAINRAAAATGSVRYAMAAAGADYNGHHTTMVWNDYRRYFVAEYHWGERVVVARDEDFRRCLARAVEEWKTQGKGATLVVAVRDDAEAAICAELGLVERTVESEKAHYATFQDWRFAEVHTAMRYERAMGIPVANLINADPKAFTCDSGYCSGYWDEQFKALRVRQGKRS